MQAVDFVTPLLLEGVLHQSRSIPQLLTCEYRYQQIYVGFGHERRFANDLALTDEVQDPLLADALSDEDPYPTRFDQEQLVRRVADSVDRFARPDAAADQAAHDVMLELYPSMRTTFDSQLARQLAGLPAGSATRDGVAVGSAAAHALLTERQQDGSARPPAAFVAGTVSGAYRPTPPKFGPPMFTSWGSVRPFLLNNPGQFRPAGERRPHLG